MTKSLAPHDTTARVTATGPAVGRDGRGEPPPSLPMAAARQLAAQLRREPKPVMPAAFTWNSINHKENS